MFDAFENLMRLWTGVAKACELAVEVTSFFFNFILVKTSDLFPTRGWAFPIFVPLEVTEFLLVLVALALLFSICSQLRLCHVREGFDAFLRMTSSDAAVDTRGGSS